MHIRYSPFCLTIFSSHCKFISRSANGEEGGKRGGREGLKKIFLESTHNELMYWILYYKHVNSFELFLLYERRAYDWNSVDNCVVFHDRWVCYDTKTTWARANWVARVPTHTLLLKKIHNVSILVNFKGKRLRCQNISLVSISVNGCWLH